ncbi:hypothetical protein SDC9_152447 [bioreactor metagenome]|uniref:Uncharacterized protein n=1 Tax=bioreactor metagenome TaxID=1076179 RepID=A0A645ETM3_9ZZZZ
MAAATAAPVWPLSAANAAGAVKSNTAEPDRLLPGRMPTRFAAAETASSSLAYTSSTMPSFAASSALPALAVLSPAAAEVKGAVKNSSASFAMTVTSAAAAATACEAPQTPRITAIWGTTPEMRAPASTSFAASTSAPGPCVSTEPLES